MRRNEQAEKRKHGITCHTSSPLETGVLQRDSRVWLHPKRRLACPLGRLPMKPNGARRSHRMDVPRRGTLLRSDQYANYAKRHSVSSSEAKSMDLCLTRMRVNAQEEKRKHGITCHTSSPLETGVPQRDFRVWLHPKRRLACPLRRLPMKPNGPRRRRRMDVPRRGTLLRSEQHANCAKRYFVSSFRAKREIFVIRGLAVNDWNFQTGNLLSIYLRASPHIYCSEAATTSLKAEVSG